MKKITNQQKKNRHNRIFWGQIDEKNVKRNRNDIRKEEYEKLT